MLIFYHPEFGTWCTDGMPAQRYLDKYPKGTIEITADPTPGPGRTFDGTKWIDKPKSLDDLRMEKIAGIIDAADAILSAGAPVSGGLHVALDDGSRADLTAMAATATAAASGAVSWPDSYARGWITVENVRLPLATPAAGLSLAASVGSYYAAIVQHRRDLKDAALAAKDEAALNAIDISVGWPV